MTVLYIILGIVAAVLLIAAVMPSTYSIEKTITVNAPAQKAFEKVSNFNNYREWNPWQKMEPDAKSTVSGQPGKPGHKYEWKGKKIGEGFLLVKEAKEFSSVNIDLQFIKPWNALGVDNWTFEKTGDNQTKITWKNGGPLNYPVARLMGPMINKNLNQQFDQGLKSLKEACEK